MRVTKHITLLMFVGAIPAFCADEFVRVDLATYANQQLDEDFFPGHYAGDNLEELARGDQSFGGIPFRVDDGLIQVAGKFLKDHPTLVEIRFDERVEKLHFLHAARWGAYGKRGDGLGHWVADGTPIGYYEIVYDDGHAESIPIIYGADVRDWWNVWDDSKPTKRSRVVWNGNNTHLRRRNEALHTATPLRLYLTTWENPHPESRIISINFATLKQTAAPFCVAISGERGQSGSLDRIRRLEEEVNRLKQQLDRLEP